MNGQKDFKNIILFIKYICTLLCTCISLYLCVSIWLNVSLYLIFTLTFFSVDSKIIKLAIVQFLTISQYFHSLLPKILN